ncbi:MAG TPA: endolytic transglycosylase MltG [Anaerolineaceae bacterium]|nr:endolytic transglycosylase MltG [Anaerolineaceae bacterium]
MSVTKRRSGLPIFLLVLILILGAVLAYGVVLAPARAKTLFGPPDARLNLVQRSRSALALLDAREELLGSRPGAGKSGKFSISADESVRGICARLETEGYVPSGDAICTYLTYSGFDRMVQAGTFTISENLSPLEIARKIADPAARDIAFTVFAGWRMEEIAAAVDLSGFSFSGQEYLNSAMNPTSEARALLNLPDSATLEGYFLPDSYSFEPDIPLESMISVMYTRFAAAVQDARFQEGLARQNLSLHQAVTLASVIERETRADEEKARIASVFYNRLAADMRLETDPTVQYALGFDSASGTWWKSPLSLEDLAVDSPYNTYLYKGLPPGPISNPTLITLIAAVAPEQTPFYYFRASCDGSGTHVFSITFEEHLNNACP